MPISITEVPNPFVNTESILSVANSLSCQNIYYLHTSHIFAGPVDGNRVITNFRISWILPTYLIDIFLSRLTNSLEINFSSWEDFAIYGDINRYFFWFFNDIMVHTNVEIQGSFYIRMRFNVRFISHSYLFRCRINGCLSNNISIFIQQIKGNTWRECDYIW